MRRRVAAIAATLAIVLLASATVAGATKKPEANKAPAWAEQAITETKALNSADGDLEVEVRAGGQKTKVAESFAFDRSKRYFSSSVRTPQSDYDLQFIAVGDQAWIASGDPAFRSRLPDGFTVVGIPTAQLEASGLVSTDLDRTFAFLAALRGATHVKSKKVTIEREYRFDIDFDRAARLVPDAERAVYQSFYGNFTKRTVSRATGSASVNDQHRVVGFDVDIALRPAAGRNAGFRLRVDFGSVNDFEEVLTMSPGSVVSIDQVPGILDLLRGTGTKLPGGTTKSTDASPPA